MKNSLEQLKFLDKILLPACGISSINDFDSVVSSTSLEKRLNKINYAIEELQKVFPVKQFSFHKTNYKVQSCTQAFFVLKTCLQIAVVPVAQKGTNELRLLSTNILLEKYRQDKKKTEEMSDTRTIDTDFCIPNLEETHVSTQNYNFECKHGKKPENIPYSTTDNASTKTGRIIINGRDTNVRVEDNNQEEKSEYLQYLHVDNINKYVKSEKPETIFSYTTKKQISLCTEYKLPLPPFRKNLKSIVLKPIVTEFSSQENVEADLEDRAICIFKIGNETIHEVYWSKGKNLLPTHPYILPVDILLTYHDFSVSMKIGDDDDVFKHIKYFEIQLQTVEFYANIEKQFLNSKKKWFIPIPDNRLILSDGLGELESRFSGYKLTKSNKKNKYKNFDHQTGEFYNIDNVRIFRTDKDLTLYSLVNEKSSSIDVVCENKIFLAKDMTNYIELNSEKRFLIKVPIAAISDTISNIELTGDYHVKKRVQKTFISNKKNKNYKEIQQYSGANQVNILGTFSIDPINIILEMNSLDDALEVREKINVSYDLFWFHPETRRKLSTEFRNIIDVDIRTLF